MFHQGQAVICVDEKMEWIGSALIKTTKEKTVVYHIRNHWPANECENLFRDHPLARHANYHENGGRVELEEMPGCYWFGRRFQVR